MKTNNLKRGLSLLLAMAMCLSLFLGIAPTTVSAAGEKSDVYLIAYPVKATIMPMATGATANCTK